MELKEYIPLVTALAGAFVGGFFQIVLLNITSKSKIKELEYLKENTFTENKMKVARGNLETLYKPLYKLIIKIEDIYLNLTEENKKRLSNYIKELDDTYKALKLEGETIFLLPTFQDEIEYLIDLLNNSIKNDSNEKKLIIYTTTTSSITGLKNRKVQIYDFIFGFAIMVPLIEIFKFLQNILIPKFLDKIIDPFKYEESHLKIYSANIKSGWFKTAFQNSVKNIEYLIKEISLSSYE